MKKSYNILGLFLYFVLSFSVKAQENLIFDIIAQEKTQGLSFNDVSNVLTLREREKQGFQKIFAI